MFRLFLIVAAILQVSYAFSPTSSLAITTSRTAAAGSRFVRPALYMVDDDASEESSASSATTTSLEDKMKSWEASEEEIKAATLGGVVPGSSGSGEGRTDAFDVGLYIAFPIMVISCLAFVFFPLIIGNIDVNSVGPPPTS
ncbi:hypothetical protein ACHAXR_009478 [Thalassiosira sp. AJA248-18]